MNEERPTMTETRSWSLRDLAFGILGLLFWLTGLRWWALRGLRRTRRILISCLDYFVEADPHDVEKRQRLSPRTVLMARPGDIVVTFRPLTMAMARYAREVLGFDPTVLSPSVLLGAHGGDLLRSIAADEKLLGALRAHRGVLDPLIQRRGLLEIAERSGARLPRTRRQLLLNDDVLRRLNSKKWFQKVARRLGIGVPNSVWVYGKVHILSAARQMFCDHPGLAELRLRKDVSAGGLGVLPLRRPSSRLWRLSDLAAQLPADADFENSAWAVEPLLPVAHAFSVVMRITAVGPVLVDTCDRLVLNSSESAGGMVPSQLERWVLDDAVRMTLRFGWYLWTEGYRGEVDMDWGLVKGGGLVAFESNVRTPATMTQIALRENHAHGRGVAIGRDYVKVGPNTRLDDLLHFLAHAEVAWDRRMQRGLGWDAERGWGVYITLEPADGSMAYTVLAPHHSLARRIDEAVQEWAAGQARGASNPPVAVGFGDDPAPPPAA